MATHRTAAEKEGLKQKDANGVLTSSICGAVDSDIN